MIKNCVFVLVLAAFVGSLGAPFAAQAATSSEYEVSGWIPYWKSEEGTEDAQDNIDELDVIHPFIYTVTSKGKISEQSDIDDDEWEDLFETAKDEGVKVVPTIMWSSGAQIDEILSNKKTRTAHIKEIVRLVKREKFDGINIDYEQKLADTREDFSLFLKELKKALGSKTLACAVEARTPPDSLYRTVPTNLEYANDYKEIGTHCDVVQIMGYDQGRADYKLNDAKSGSPYIPVADADWVRKVIEVTIKDIPRNKIMLGVPTYGAEYEVTVSPNWFKSYRKIQSVNQPYALALASTTNSIPSRNKAGELSYSYLAPSVVTSNPSFAAALPKLTVPAGTPVGNTVSQKALAYANQTGQTVTFNLVWWSDSEAIQDKVDLVKEFGLRGIAMFKIDGEEDEKVWDVLN